VKNGTTLGTNLKPNHIHPSREFRGGRRWPTSREPSAGRTASHSRREELSRQLIVFHWED
jgi:hypothetical protein